MVEKHKKMDYSLYRPFLKPVLFIVFGFLLLGAALFIIVQSGAFATPKVEIIDESVAAASVTLEMGNLTVEVAGAVAKPGVYTVSAGSRIHDALVLAGNLLISADRDYVEKSINQAAKLVDGQKIYIPKEGEAVKSPVLGITSSESTNGGLININNASASELDTLPGVGPATSTKIINGRPYASLEELISKKSVSTKVFDQIKDKISLY